MNAWTQIETTYPYHISFDAPTQTALRAQLGRLQTEMKSDIPSVHVDWFVATAATPPLYHDLLSLPLTDRELETRLGVDVAVISQLHRGCVSGGQDSITPVSPITTGWWSGMPFEMERIGRATTLPAMLAHRTSSPTHSISHMMVGKSSSIFPTGCKDTILVNGSGLRLE